MTKEQAIERINELKGYRFSLAMKDFWNARDFIQDDEWYNELYQLNKQFNLNIDLRVGY